MSLKHSFREATFFIKGGSYQYNYEYCDPIIIHLRLHISVLSCALPSIGGGMLIRYITYAETSYLCKLRVLYQIINKPCFACHWSPQVNWSHTHKSEPFRHIQESPNSPCHKKLRHVATTHNCNDQPPGGKCLGCSL